VSHPCLAPRDSAPTSRQAGAPPNTPRAQATKARSNSTMQAYMNFFELLGVSSDQLADAMPERIVEVSVGAEGGRGGAVWGGAGRGKDKALHQLYLHNHPNPTPPPPPHPTTQPPQAFHTGGKEAVREVVYSEVAEKLRAPLHVRSAEPGGGEAVYGAGQPGRPVYLMKDAKDLFTRVHEDGAPYALRDDLPLMGGGGGMGGGGAPRPRKPRPSGGAAGASARDKERDLTWEVRPSACLLGVGVCVGYKGWLRGRSDDR